MDLYLPADYLSLREELDDWRDAEPEHGATTAPEPGEPVDPTWQTL
ncbi:MAG: hypothetical protein JSS28_13105 [Proteobacteria bacterium]|nr:hypothetical protein [Pseudomonadota bacterium]